MQEGIRKKEYDTNPEKLQIDMDDTPQTEESSSNRNALSRLRFIPLSIISCQESLDPRRVKLISQSILRDGFLRHPIYVGHFDAKRFTLFDGHNRLAAFMNLRIPAILAQIVPYSDIEAATWIQVAEGRVDKYLRALRLKGFTIRPSKSRIGLVGKRELAATIYSRSASFDVEIDIDMGIDVVGATNLLLETIIKITDSRIERKPDTDLQDIIKTLENKIAIQFPTFSPIQVISAIRRGEKLGAGVTRWEIKNRIVNACLPLGPWLNRHPDELNATLDEVIKTASFRFYCDHILEMEATWPW